MGSEDRMRVPPSDRGACSALADRRRGARRLVLMLVVSLVGGVAARQVAAFSAADVYREAAPSVVLIFGFEAKGGGTSGAGTILTRDGLVLTNDHVVSHATRAARRPGRVYSNLVAYLKPNPITGNNRRDLDRPYPVTVVARDAALDLALIRIDDPPADLRPIELADSEEVEIGERVAAIGHPGGGGLWTLTTGTVSSKRRDRARDIFQTDTAINPGSSGGPLLDGHARLIGVNSFVRRLNEDGLPLEGLNYSLRSQAVRDWVNRQGVARLATVARADTAGATRGVRPGYESEPAAPRDPSANTLAPPAPAPPASSIRPPAPDPEPGAREFEAPDGTRMYGVPNRENDLDDALEHARRAYADVVRRADRSVRELEAAIDDYDNF